MAGVASKMASRLMLKPMASTASFGPLLRRFSTVTGLKASKVAWMAPFLSASNSAAASVLADKKSDILATSALLNVNTLVRSIQTSSIRPATASLAIKRQLPVLLLPLPSRRGESGCEFVIRPSTSTVEELLSDIQKEDPGIETIFVTVNGTRVAKRTAMQHLLSEGFDIHVNDKVYNVAPLPATDSLITHDRIFQTEADEVKDLVKNLYAVLNMRPHLIEQSAELRRQIEANRLELTALEQELEAIKKNTEQRLVRFNYFNLFLMSVQFGMFARLTWWEYSWDIMEPVTYFTTTFHAMVLVYGWSVLTRKDLLYPVAADHFYLKWLYKLSGKHKFDIERYNSLKEKIYEDESVLKRIRNPMESNFWISPPLPRTKE